MKTIESELVELQGLVDNTGNLSHFETFNKKKNLLAELLDTVTQGALRLKVQSILIDFFFFLITCTGFQKLLCICPRKKGDMDSYIYRVEQQLFGVSLHRDF